MKCFGESVGRSLRPFLASRRLFDVRVADPVFDLLLRLVARDAVALLHPANELLRSALDLIEVAIGQLAPFFPDSALELVPLAFENRFVHLVLLHPTTG